MILLVLHEGKRRGDTVREGAASWHEREGLGKLGVGRSEVECVGLIRTWPKARENTRLDPLSKENVSGWFGSALRLWIWAWDGRRCSKDWIWSISERKKKCSLPWCARQMCSLQLNYLRFIFMNRWERRRDWPEEFMDIKLTESSRKKRKERMRERVRLVFFRRSAKDLDRVLEIVHDVWKDELGNKPVYLENN